MFKLKFSLVVIAHFWSSFLMSVAPAQTLEDLAKVLRDRSEVLAEWSVEVEVQKRRKRGREETVIPRTDGSPNAGRLPDWINSSVTESVKVSGDKWIVDRFVSDDVDLEDQRMRYAFDGSVSSGLRGNRQSWLQGEISTQNKKLVSFPEFFLGTPNGTYAEFVASVAASIDVVSGKIRVETPVREERVGSKVFHDKGVLWFDPQAGLAPFRAESFSRVGDDANWSLVRSWQVSEFHQDSTGVFLPQKVEVQHYRLSDGSSQVTPIDAALYHIEQYEFRNWSIGKADDGETFRVGFPANVVVHDQRVGKYHQAFELSDWEILQEVESVEKFSPVQRYAVFLILGLVVTLVGWFAFRRMVVK
jgi:hypothetical protein